MQKASFYMIKYSWISVAWSNWLAWQHAFITQLTIEGECLWPRGLWHAVQFINWNVKIQEEFQHWSGNGSSSWALGHEREEERMREKRREGRKEERRKEMGKKRTWGREREEREETWERWERWWEMSEEIGGEETREIMGDMKAMEDWDMGEKGKMWEKQRNSSSGHGTRTTDTYTHTYDWVVMWM